MAGMAQTQEPVAVAVVGVGRMGRHHARTYAVLPGARLLAVVDADAERAGDAAEEYGCAACATTEELLERFPRVQAVTVATPTKFHVAAAAPLLRAKVACLVEKPIAGSVAEARELVELAGRTGTPLQVGHTERFNPAVRAVAALNIPARFVEVDRVSPMTFRSLDVGVVLDLMIHDLDIVLMLARSGVKSVEAVGVAVMGEHEDVASARVHFENGCVANLTASRLALKTERKLRLFSEAAYVSLDYQRRSGVVIHRTANDAALGDVRAQIAGGADLSSLDYSKLVRVDELSMGQEESDPLRAELTSFLECVRTGRRPEVDAEAGLAAVDAAERVRAAIRAHRWEGLDTSAWRV